MLRNCDTDDEEEFACITQKINLNSFYTSSVDEIEKGEDEEIYYTANEFESEELTLQDYFFAKNAIFDMMNYIQKSFYFID